MDYNDIQDMAKILGAFNNASSTATTQVNESVNKPVSKSQDPEMAGFLALMEDKAPVVEQPEVVEAKEVVVESKKQNTSDISKYLQAIYDEKLAEQLRESAAKQDRVSSIAKRAADKVNESNYKYTGKQSALSKHMSKAKRPAATVSSMAKAEASRYLGDDTDPVDTVTLDIPLLIRLLEYSREDAKTDMDLHNVTEKLIELSKTTDVLSMDKYDAIVGEQEALPAPDEESDLGKM